MKVKDIKELSIQDLEKKIKGVESDYISLKIDLISNSLKDTSKVRKTRKLLAQFKTVLSEKKELKVEDRNKRSTKTGVVLKSSGLNTVAVLVEDLKQHKKYKKTLQSSKKYLAHVEQTEVSVGDKVIIASCRPLSKTKHWRVVSVVGSKQ